jgi:succinyl-CoA synthetase beta subunit
MPYFAMKSKARSEPPWIGCQHSTGRRGGAGINGILKGFGWAANPADVTGFANSESFPQIMEHMINDPRMRTLVVASAGADAQAQQVISQRDRTDKGVVFLWTGSRDRREWPGTAQTRPDTDLLHAGQIGPRPAEPPRGSHVARASPGRWLCRGPAAHGAAGCGHRPGGLAWGVASAREHRANSAEAAVAAAERLGFPVALKLDSPDIPHKTEAGAVRLNLGDAAQVRTAYAEILANAKASAPQARITGVSVQETVGGGVEVIIGVSCYPQLGPVLLFGSGGVMVEVYNDVALPLHALGSTGHDRRGQRSAVAPHFRGRPAADLAALEDTLVRVSYLAMHIEGLLAELDINPLMVLPSGQGVKAVDALVVLRGT